MCNGCNVLFTLAVLIPGFGWVEGLCISERDGNGGTQPRQGMPLEDPRSGQSAWYRSWYRSWYRDEASLFVVFPGRSFDLTNPNSRLLDFWSMAGLVRAGRRPGIYGVLVGGWARQSRPSTRRLASDGEGTSSM